MGLAETALRSGDHRRVYEVLLPAIDRMESMRSRIPAPELRTSFVERNAQVFELAIDALARLGRARDAFTLAEQARARSFLDLLAQNRSDARPGLTEDQARQQRRLESKFSRALTALDSDPSKRNERAAKQAEQDLLLFRQSVVAETSATPSATQAMTAAQVMQWTAAKGCTLVEYMLGRRRSYLWVVTPSAVKLIPLPPRTTIAKAVADYRAKIARHPQGAAFDSFLPDSQALYSTLVEPALPYVSSNRKLVIVPDGMLYYLPFETLTSKAVTPRYLIEDFEISYAPSASALASLKPLKLRSAPTSGIRRPRFLARCPCARGKRSQPSGARGL